MIVLYMGQSSRNFVREREGSVREIWKSAGKRRKLILVKRNLKRREFDEWEREKAEVCGELRRKMIL